MVPNVGFYALMYVRLQLLKHGAKANFIRPYISNVVMTGSFNCFIDMARFVAENETNCNYDPSTFSGTSYSPYGLDKTKQPRDSALPRHLQPKKKKIVVFERGKFNVMGIDSYAEAYDLVEKSAEVIMRYAVESRTPSRRKIVPLRLEELKNARESLHAEPKSKKQKSNPDETPANVY